MSNDTACRLLQEQLDYLKLSLEQQISQYQAAYQIIEQDWIKLNDPHHIAKEPSVKSVIIPAPMSLWSDDRIALYVRFACFHHGVTAHVYATELLALYEQFLGRPVGHDARHNLRDSVINSAKSLDKVIDCHSVLESMKLAELEETEPEPSWLSTFISRLNPWTYL